MTIRSALSPRFGDDWERIFGKKESVDYSWDGPIFSCRACAEQNHLEDVAPFVATPGACCFYCDNDGFDLMLLNEGAYPSGAPLDAHRRML
jgi:hypothetical protein